MSSEKFKNLAREMGPFIGLVILFIVLAVLNNDFINPANILRHKSDFCNMHLKP